MSKFKFQKMSQNDVKSLFGQHIDEKGKVNWKPLTDEVNMAVEYMVTDALSEAIDTFSDKFDFETSSSAKGDE